MKKATLDDLLARKSQAMQARMIIKQIDVPLLGMSLTVEKIPLSRVLGLIDKYNGDDSLSSKFELYKELIYLSCPMLQNKELQEAYEVADPLDIITVLLEQNLGAITKLGDEISEMYGLSDPNKTVDDLKN